MTISHHRGVRDRPWHVRTVIEGISTLLLILLNLNLDTSLLLLLYLLLMVHFLNALRSRMVLERN